MHFRIPQSSFLKLLQAVHGVVERKNTMRILECILVEADKEGLQILATDLDVGVKQRGDAEVLEPGAVCIPARKLLDITRLLPSESVDVNIKDGNRIELRCGASVFRINGLSKEEFPTLPQVEEAQKLSFPRNDLGDMIKRVVFAITNDDSRYALNGCLLTVCKGSLRMVASDGHRLALVEKKVDSLDPGSKNIEVIVPKKALGELQRLCADEEAEHVEFARKDNQVVFQCGRRTLISRLLEGQFPNYERVIPKENVFGFEVSTEQLGAALKRVALLASEHSRAVRLAVAPGKVELSASTPEQGEAREELKVAYEGDRIHVGFNVRYLLDFVSAVGSDEVRLSLRDKDTQGLLTPVGLKNEDYRYVIMPMRLEESADEATS
ncbi:MAG: DNA polymerase III subunit beta [Acidobacteriota bacterium]